MSTEAWIIGLHLLSLHAPNCLEMSDRATAVREPNFTVERRGGNIEQGVYRMSRRETELTTDNDAHCLRTAGADGLSHVGLKGVTYPQGCEFVYPRPDFVARCDATNEIRHGLAPDQHHHRRGAIVLDYQVRRDVEPAALVQRRRIRRWLATSPTRRKQRQQAGKKRKCQCLVHASTIDQVAHEIYPLTQKG